MATVADIVTGILVTELAADDDMTMLAMVDSRNLLINKCLEARQKQKKRILHQVAHASIRKKFPPIARKRRKRKSDNNFDHDYLDNTIPWFCDDEFTEFRNHFKIERSTFDKIVSHVSPNFGKQDKCTLPIERKILVAMWLLSSQESFRAIGEKFGLQKSTTYYAFVQFVGVLNASAREFIFWPELENLKMIAAEFERNFHLPGAVGVVQCCQIPVKVSPTDIEGTSEQRTEPYATLMLQAVCDSTRLKFLDIHMGSPQPNQTVTCAWKFFESSDLGRDLCSGGGMSEIPPEYHLLGGTVYPQRSFLLTPYKDEVAAISEAARNFNAVHRAARLVTHHALALLRSRFSRLKYVDTLRDDLVPQIVMASCVLHNMIVEEEGAPDLSEVAADPDYMSEDTVNPCLQTEHHLDDEAVVKRDEIANRLFI